MKKSRLCTLVGTLALLTTVSTHAYDKYTTEADNPQNADKGSKAAESNAWFKLGDMRLINNDWGAAHLGCSNKGYEIFVEDDGTFGWEFHRYGCGGDKGFPDYPEIEFGIHPFGTAWEELATTPDYSSTDLLPLKINEIQDMSIDIEDYNIKIDDGGSWNLNFEMWFTTDHPVTGTHDRAHTELMIFWGWNHDRWGGEPGVAGNKYMDVSGNTYRLMVNRANWGSMGPQWNYYQFRAGDGGAGSVGYSFNGTLNVKDALDWLVADGLDPNLWLSRLELGTEIDDGTSGRVSFKNLTFHVNGESRGIVYGGEDDPWEAQVEPSSSSEAPESSSSIESSSEGAPESSSIESSSSEVSSSDEEESSSEAEKESSSEDESSAEISPLHTISTITQGSSIMYRISGNNTINLTVSEAGMYSVNVYNVMGNAVATYNNQNLESGDQHLPLNTSVGEGLYLIKTTLIK